MFEVLRRRQAANNDAGASMPVPYLGLGAAFVGQVVSSGGVTGSDLYHDVIPLSLIGDIVPGAPMGFSSEAPYVTVLVLGPNRPEGSNLIARRVDGEWVAGKGQSSGVSNNYSFWISSCSGGGVGCTIRIVYPNGTIETRQGGGAGMVSWQGSPGVYTITINCLDFFPKTIVYDTKNPGYGFYRFHPRTFYASVGWGCDFNHSDGSSVPTAVTTVTLGGDLSGSTTINAPGVYTNVNGQVQIQIASDYQSDTPSYTVTGSSSNYKTTTTYYSATVPQGQGDGSAGNPYSGDGCSGSVKMPADDCHKCCFCNTLQDSITQFDTPPASFFIKDCSGGGTVPDGNCTHTIFCTLGRNANAPASWNPYVTIYTDCADNPALPGVITSSYNGGFVLFETMLGQGFPCITTPSPGNPIYNAKGQFDGIMYPDGGLGPKRGFLKLAGFYKVFDGGCGGVSYGNAPLMMPNPLMMANPLMMEDGVIPPFATQPLALSSRKRSQWIAK